MRPLKPVLEPLFPVLGSQPRPLTRPPPKYLHTQKARRGLHSAPIAPRRSPQVAARRGVSVGGQSPRLARPPRARHGRALPCRHRSRGGTGSQQPAPQSAGSHDRRVTLQTRAGPHERAALRGGEGRAEPAPAAPERRRSRTRRFHHRAASGAS